MIGNAAIFEESFVLLFENEALIDALSMLTVEGRAALYVISEPAFPD